MKNTNEFGDSLSLQSYTVGYRNWNVAKIGTFLNEDGLLAHYCNCENAKQNLFSLQIEERYGEVNWDPDVKTTYCYQCVEVSVESTGL
jgi:hypothetical protein